MREGELVQYVREEAGKYLRGVVQYDDEAFEILYVREDLRNQAFLERVETIHEQLIVHSTGEPDVDAWGETLATLNVREDAIVLNLRASRSSGFLVGLEPEAARQLDEFINSCMNRAVPGHNFA